MSNESSHQTTLIKTARLDYGRFIYYIDIIENNKGQFLKIKEYRPKTDESNVILVPRNLIAEFSKQFNEVIKDVGGTDDCRVERHQSGSGDGSSRSS